MLFLWYRSDLTERVMDGQRRREVNVHGEILHNIDILTSIKVYACVCVREYDKSLQNKRKPPPTREPNELTAATIRISAFPVNTFKT